MPAASPIRVGLLGCGTVGGAAATILVQHADELTERARTPIELRRIAVRDASKDRGLRVPADIWTDDPWEVVNDPELDVVIETIGGIDPARELVLAALKAGKHVVTANKDLLAAHGREILDAAEDAGVDVLYEASVGGGIPIVRPIKESLAGDRVRQILGIVNGTTNFILTRMSETGESFEDALAEATRLGYSEQDPTADIEGHDAAAKLAILASLAFNAEVVPTDVDREGIAQVKAADIAAAHDLGYEVKLLAVAEEDGGQVSVRVHPTMIPKTHPLASVRDVNNAVFVVGEETGELMFYGRGAGGGPTGSAIVGDVVEAARNIRGGGRSIGSTTHHSAATIKPADQTLVRYYVVLSVADQPGVLASVAGAFANHSVSIASVRQEGFGDEATLTLITHTATVGRHVATFADLERLDSVKTIRSRMRVEGTDER